MEEKTAKKENLTVKTMAIIEYMSMECRRMPLQLIAEGVGVSSATAHRILTSLKEMGYVDQLENKDYYLTFKLLSTSGRIVERDRYMEQMLPYLNYFALTTPCGISLTAFSEDACINLMSVGKNIKFRSQLVVPGTAHPCHCTAAGKLFLAMMSDEELEGWLSRNRLLPFTDRTIIYPEKLREEIRRTRERGYGISDGEYAESIAILALPVPIVRGGQHTAINFSMNRSEFDQINNPEFIRSVKTMISEKKLS